MSQVVISGGQCSATRNASREIDGPSAEAAREGCESGRTAGVVQLCGQQRAPRRRLVCNSGSRRRRRAAPGVFFETERRARSPIIQNRAPSSRGDGYSRFVDAKTLDAITRRSAISEERHCVQARHTAPARGRASNSSSKRLSRRKKRCCCREQCKQPWPTPWTSQETRSCWDGAASAASASTRGRTRR